VTSPSRVSRPSVPDGPYLVAGLGVAGLAAARALAERSEPGAVSAWARALHPYFGTDAEALRASGVALHLGGDGTDLLDECACVVKSPGIPDEEPLIAQTEARGRTLIDEAELGWRLDDRPFVGVTGTNGKSTVCALIATALEQAGRRPGSGGNSEDGPALTTLAVDPSHDVVVAELSSFQLRHSPTLLPDVAVLTNCTRDSWHRHGGREGYARDKARIAVRGASAAPHSVLPADDPLGAHLAHEARAYGGAVTTFGTATHADCRIVAADWDLEAARLTIELAGDELSLSPALPGAHNALNVAAALAAARAAGVDPSLAAQAIERADPVPGRIERISRQTAPFDLLVDYAHNPAGLRCVLETVDHVLRRRGTGRIVAAASALPVFDDGQYAEMGEVLGERADRVIATTERLRPDAPIEEPPAFFDALRRSSAELTVEVDRRLAIDRAVAEARPGDVVLILGRGRRRTPIHVPGSEPLTLDDREQARAALAVAIG